MREVAQRCLGTEVAGVGGGLVSGLRILHSRLALSLSFLFEVESQLTQACWWTGGFASLEALSPSLKHANLHTALPEGGSVLDDDAI